MPDACAFAPALFRFLRDLRKNNDRDWFTAHKDVYERDVKEPALAFISAFAPALRRISPHLVADARPVGGSMFRLHRDVRFSNDKRPYKTHVGIQFRHAKAEGAHAPGFYLHLEPGDVFAGAGIWQPDGAVLSEVRDAIAESPAAWRRAVGARDFTVRWALSGESLVRVPRGYDPDHPLAADLKRKSYIAVTGFSEREACAADFAERLANAWRASAPLMRFLTRALDLSW
ncbi:MAG TPA: DUF2461 domain-containing protein [Myxococcota bacterium]|nr:DUF2461 domain-containing protein [Myxococcota bacterium]